MINDYSVQQGYSVLYHFLFAKLHDSKELPGFMSEFALLPDGRPPIDRHWEWWEEAFSEVAAGRRTLVASDLRHVVLSFVERLNRRPQFIDIQEIERVLRSDSLDEDVAWRYALQVGRTGLVHELGLRDPSN